MRGLIDARREPAVDDGRRRGADAARVRRRRAPIFLRNWPYALDLFEQADSPVRGRVGIARAARAIATAARGAGLDGRLARSAVNRNTRHPEVAVALARLLPSEHGAAR